MKGLAEEMVRKSNGSVLLGEIDWKVFNDGFPVSAITVPFAIPLQSLSFSLSLSVSMCNIWCIFHSIFSVQNLKVHKAYNLRWCHVAFLADLSDPRNIFEQYSVMLGVFGYLQSVIR